MYLSERVLGEGKTRKRNTLLKSSNIFVGSLPKSQQEFARPPIWIPYRHCILSKHIMGKSLAEKDECQFCGLNFLKELLFNDYSFWKANKLTFTSSRWLKKKERLRHFVLNQISSFKIIHAY